MLRTLFVHCLAVTSIVLLSYTSAFSLQCPEAPKQTNEDWEVEVNAAVAKIGLAKGGDLRTHTKSATQDLLARLPNADKLYMEQMMFAAFCSALRDDKTLKESEKAQRLKEYRDGVQQAIKTPSPKHKPRPIAIKTPDSGDAYIASERPWVSVDAAISSDLIRRPEGIEFGVNFTVNNHGKSPAINVHVLYEAVPLIRLQAGDPFAAARQRIYDLGMKSKMGENMGIQLFPSEAKTIPWTNTLRINEIESATNPGFLPSFYIVGSVFYEVAFDQKIRRTDFIYYVGALGDPRYPKGSDVPVFTGRFPKGRIFLDPAPYSKGTIS